MKSMELVIIHISGKSGPLIFKYLLLPRTEKTSNKNPVCNMEPDVISLLLE